MPYWATPWASGLFLAETVLARPEALRGRRVLELGCGLGTTADRGGAGARGGGGRGSGASSQRAGRGAARGAQAGWPGGGVRRRGRVRGDAGVLPLQRLAQHRAGGADAPGGLAHGGGAGGARPRRPLRSGAGGGRALRAGGRGAPAGAGAPAGGGGGRGAGAACRPGGVLEQRAGRGAGSCGWRSRGGPPAPASWRRWRRGAGCGGWWRRSGSGRRGRGGPASGCTSCAPAPAVPERRPGPGHQEASASAG